MYEDRVNLILMLVGPTKFSSTNTSALHPGWRDAIWSVQIRDVWDQFFDDLTPEANWKHFDRVHNPLERLRKLTPGAGVSISRADIWEPKYTDAFWGEENYRRLKAIKAKVDLGKALSNYMAVGWREEDER